MNVLIIICSFLVGIGTLYFAQCIQTAIKNHKQKKKKSSVREKRNIGTMDAILVIIGVILFVFTVIMIYIFCTLGSIPDTLITCVFAVCGGECGIMGWIKTTKERQKERKWQIEDENNKTLEEGGKDERYD